MPVRGWKGFPSETKELLEAATELLEAVERLERKAPGQELMESRLELAIEDFKFQNAVA